MLLLLLLRLMVGSNSGGGGGDDAIVGVRPRKARQPDRDVMSGKRIQQ